MAKETGKERLERRRQHVKNYVQEQHEKGVSIKASVIELSERLFLSERAVEMDLYYKGQTTPKPSKHKF